MARTAKAKYVIVSIVCCHKCEYCKKYSHCGPGRTDMRMGIGYFRKGDPTAEARRKKWKSHSARITDNYPVQP